jgi:protease II
MTATLRAATVSGTPALLRVDKSAGHGSGSSRAQHEAKFADHMSLMSWRFGVPAIQPRTQAER